MSLNASGTPANHNVLVGLAVADIAYLVYLPRNCRWVTIQGHVNLIHVSYSGTDGVDLAGIGISQQAEDVVAWPVNAPTSLDAKPFIYLQSPVAGTAVSIALSRGEDS